MRFLPVFLYGLNGNLRCFIIWKMKFPGRDAAKRNISQIIFLRQCQTGTVAGRKKFFVFLCKPSLNNRPNRMQNIAAGQVKGRCNFCFAGLFFVALLFHQFGAGEAKLNACIGVDRIVDATVTRAEAAQHLAVRRIDNRITGKCGNIPLPEINTFLHRR